MSYLADTNLLVRLANLSDPAQPLEARAIEDLRDQGEIIYITPQVLTEFRAIASRPFTANGLGLSASEAEIKAMEFEALFRQLEEISAIFPAWKALVAAAGVVGKQVHDTRLVAVCHVHGVTHLLTFNGPHFLRVAGFGSGIEVVDLAEV